MRKFLLHILFYSLPLMAALAYYLFFVDKEAMRNDIGRMTQLEFHYTKPTADSSIVAAPCRDVCVEEASPLADDEIVVFGDSFSFENDRMWHCGRWHQFMAAALGKKVVSIGNHTDPFECYLSTLVHHPERLSDTVIVESVERELVGRLCWLDFDSVADFQSIEPPSEEGSWYATLKTKMRKPAQYYQRRLGIDVPVLHFKLDGEYFSARSSTLYCYEYDIEPSSDYNVSTACDNLRRLDSLSRAQGITLLVVAIPNKYTVYHNHILGGANDKTLLEHPCPFDTISCFINTTKTLTTLVEDGVKDVYLPDDTHFSYTGAQALGLSVAKIISSRY